MASVLGKLDLGLGDPKWPQVPTWLAFLPDQAFGFTLFL